MQCACSHCMNWKISIALGMAAAMTGLAVADEQKRSGPPEKVGHTPVFYSEVTISEHAGTILATPAQATATNAVAAVSTSPTPGQPAPGQNDRPMAPRNLRVVAVRY